MADWVEKHPAEPPTLVESLDLEGLAPGTLHRLAVTILDNAISRTVRVPCLVARGVAPGPVVGLTAALHGNELNGIPTIHHLFSRIDPSRLRGTVVAVLVANVPGFLTHQREYQDGKDLNRLMPGKADGSESQVYAFRLMDRIVSRFEVLIDLHTASFGRVNSLYVRADMTAERTAHLARLIGAQIIVHNQGGDGTLRAAAAARGIDAVTVEIGDPQIFDDPKIRSSRIGLRDVVEAFGMVEPDEETPSRKAIECGRSYWLFTDTGGLLHVEVAPAQRVRRGQRVATLVDPWGQSLRSYVSPDDAIVVGRSTNPVAHTGSRIVHLGIEGPPVAAATA
jgi:uncharacterized protein